MTLNSPEPSHINSTNNSDAFNPQVVFYLIALN
jgi:hypothetical protein